MTLTLPRTAASAATHYKPTHCLLCGGRDLVLALPMARSAIGNDYFRMRQPQETYSLNLHLCQDCGNVQIEDVVQPDLLFRAYTYSTTSSLGLNKHFENYAAEVGAAIGSERGALIVDIGSNDGSLLKAFRERGCRVVGVDPAVAIAARATEQGIPTLPEYFSMDVAHCIRDEYGPAAIVTANNVFAHSDQLPAMADGIRELLRPDGFFTFEVSYMMDIVQKMLFDTVYHEHLCYHSARSLQSFFARHGLELIRLQRIPTKGGSVRGTVQRQGGPRPVSGEIARFIEWERLTRLHSVDAFRAYARRIETARDELTSLLDRVRAAGKCIAGYGASPTVTTLLNEFNLARRLDFLVDDNPVKQNTYSPGDHLPVYPSEAIYEREADVVVVLAWNYVAPILTRHQRFIAEGGQFIAPLPQLQVMFS